MKPKTATTKKPSSVDCIDGLQDCFRKLTTLAALLEAAGQCPDTRVLKVETLVQAIGHAGTLMLAEMGKANQWLALLDESQRKAAR
jgi:hypothetical protein